MPDCAGSSALYVTKAFAKGSVLSDFSPKVHALHQASWDAWDCMGCMGRAGCRDCASSPFVVAFRPCPAGQCLSCLEPCELSPPLHATSHLTFAHITGIVTPPALPPHQVVVSTPNYLTVQVGDERHIMLAPEVSDLAWAESDRRCDQWVTPVQWVSCAE